MIDAFKNEKWKEIAINKDTQGVHYAISNYGRIKKYLDSIEESKIINTSYIKNYPYFGTTASGKRVSFYVHLLVAKYFLDPPNDPKQRFVIHLDYNNENNHFSNLMWANSKEVYNHNTTSPANIKARQKGHKLTSTQVIRIKKMLFDPNRKTRMKMIAKQFKISEMQLYRIKVGENWAHIKVDA